MTKAQRDLVDLLLKPGHYLIDHNKNNSRKRYKVMQGNANPVRFIPKISFDRYSDLMKCDTKGRFTFNLSQVRKQSGHTYVKQQYRKLKDLKNVSNNTDAPTRV